MAAALDAVTGAYGRLAVSEMWLPAFTLVSTAGHPRVEARLRRALAAGLEVVSVGAVEAVPSGDAA